ncbi:hypothetical protein PE074_08910 [Wohlfahrtiimonas chitiniclastica]|uniref:Chromosome partitioning protein ParA n=1 Tax=Wohlfahrtiimonas chitiniclastica SH04 TaxID=1261130 RepID=L8XXD2_9GAMM|nr:hypothetical protein [Wohlfahrtiimonas chitiniclastica]ELV08562.1 Hypothetical protein F387_01160 [Wohlfahrtiimonas chitiniclastica SH04]KZS22752.1 hypothetical protein BMY_0579 [Wohlfahrtiimonas chitiniclastica]WHR55204.1 hypothetical protein PE074_08910 [Wohlfahrtiimonas chitiniclastica]
MGNQQQQSNNNQIENSSTSLQQQNFEQKLDELKKRELALQQREKELDVRSLELENLRQQQEAKKLEIEHGLPALRDKIFAEREQTLVKYEESLNARNLELEKRHQEQEARSIEIEQGLPALRDEIFSEREQQLIKLQEQLKKQRNEINDKEQQLQVKREELDGIQEKVDGDFSSQRADLQRELQQKRSEARADLNDEIQQKREIEFKNLDIEVQQQRDDLEELRQSLEKQQAELIADQNSVKLDQAKADALNKSLAQKIEDGIQIRLQEFEQDHKQFKQEKQRLLNRIEQQNKIHSEYDELKKALGDRSAEEVLHDLTSKNEELIRLREDLKRPSQELEEYYDNHRAEVTKLEQERQQLQDEVRKLQNSLDVQEQLEYDQERLQLKYSSLEVNYEAVIADNNKLKETLERVSPSYKDPATINERLKNIKRPYLQDFVPRRQESNINELEWLESIRSGISNYGLYFSQRILYAFHTALKIAEWSPLTVLAGVSGTGKSELPKLYSRFGGINFINVPVQPNWDSQESMLGYFNSISNSYEAQPMLNFLVQSREKLVVDSENREDNYNGLSDTVSLVLLDEMNLAHVELYFADFLSKLEQRRGAKNSELPHIDINLGSDIDPYKLSLGRNLLFAGTMNQDETTKSLSDKVIDRGTSIFFPRPTSLHRREELKVLPKQADLLSMKAWWNWIEKQSSLSEEMIKYYKQLIENINTCLGADGKALGHRVWQSIEYYMVNHPLVIALDQYQYPDEHKEALKFAFEDQLVQKVMPKLRGIETRGYVKEHCLDPIRELLAKEKLDILDDFDKAMRIGHGQFNWVSADYLNNEQSNARYEELLKIAISASASKQKTTNELEQAQGV